MIRFKLFSWEKDKKKKDPNPCLSFQTTYGGKKNNILLFLYEYHLPVLCCLPAMSPHTYVSLSETPPASGSVLMSL